AVERFVALIREETGNLVPAARQPFLAGLLDRRAATAGLAPAAYLEALAEGRLAGEWDRLVPMVTIKESYFYRAPQQFVAIEERLLPDLVHRRAADRRLRIWCAATARGEEAGTLALLLAESPALAGWDWRILATDLDLEALAAARRGLYGERSVAHVPPVLLERWFRRRGKLYELSPTLRRQIDYRPVNLTRPFDDLAAAGPFDLVLLRNVLIYFGRPMQRRVLAAAAELLAPDGALLLGASETLWQMQDRLAAFDLGSCFCYRHRPAGSDEPLNRLPAGDPPRRRAGGAVSPRAPRQVAAQPRGRPASADRPPPTRRRARPPASVEPVAEASPPRLLHADPCGTQERLAAAARLLVADDLAAAAGELAAVLASEPSEPAAHALEGFLADLERRSDEAIRSYRAALYLDPALYQVRLLLADLLGRRGHQERAAHQYREVLALIASGRHRALVALDELPLPDREGAERRCRLALGGRPS
ncbi:MAG TPA: CheR family methyltransferase, partial [Thermoanaerobaculia bacterium]|nr:CheR family methyltransferase [Thermoanaerobaculia bacterium]